MQVRIRVYANMKGLASTYCSNQILDNALDFQLFVRGFNMGVSMCDFVDAGDGKECADAKLKGVCCVLLCLELLDFFLPSSLLVLIICVCKPKATPPPSFYYS